MSGLITEYTAPRTQVLLLGASGGVGSFMCQMLSVWGAQVRSYIIFYRIAIVRSRNS